MARINIGDNSQETNIKKVLLEPVVSCESG